MPIPDSIGPSREEVDPFTQRPIILLPDRRIRRRLRTDLAWHSCPGAELSGDEPLFAFFFVCLWKASPVNTVYIIVVKNDHRNVPRAPKHQK